MIGARFFHSLFYFLEGALCLHRGTDDLRFLAALTHVGLVSSLFLLS